MTFNIDTVLDHKLKIVKKLTDNTDYVLDYELKGYIKALDWVMECMKKDETS